MNDENDNSLAARIAALCAKAQKADELQETVAKMGRIIESQNREAQWYLKRNAELHDEIGKHTKRNATLSKLYRERGERIVALIRENVALKREVETLRKQVAEYEAVNEPEPSPSLLDMVCATRVYTDEEWQDWVDAAYERNRS